MKCQNCGTEVQEGMSFCMNCGTRIIAPTPPEKPEGWDYCPNCGELVPMNASFCGSCGQKISNPLPTIGTDLKSMPIAEPVEPETPVEVSEPAAESIPFETPTPEVQEPVFVREMEPVEEDVPAAVCPVCGAAVEPGTLFCSVCGHKMAEPEPIPEPEDPEPVTVFAALPVEEPEPIATPEQEPVTVCPVCGAAVEPGTLFCSVCGHKMVEPEPIPEPEDPEPETVFAALPVEEPEPIAAPEPEPVTVCPVCGAVVEPGTLFCSTCGHKMSEPVPTPDPEPVFVAEPEPVVVPEPEPATVCPVCGAVVEPGTLFCSTCGHKMSEPAPAPEPEPAIAAEPEPATVCPQCGAVVEPGTLFCSTCGHKMSEPAPAPEPEPVFVAEPEPEPVYVSEPAATAFCPNCGAAVTPGAPFCSACGYRLAESVQPAPQPLPTPQPLPVQQPATPVYPGSAPLPTPSSYPTGTMQGQAPISAAPTGDKPLGLKWFKFLIYFALFFGAFVNIVTAITYMTGLVYTAQGSSGSIVYSVFPGLRIVDILYGLLLIGYSVFVILVRFRLAKFKKGAPMLYLIALGVSLAVSVLYNILVHIVLSVYGAGPTFPIASILGTVVSSGAMIAINYVYFNHRKDMFNN